MPVGKVGGGSPIANIAAVLAEPAAKSPHISPKLHLWMWRNWRKLPTGRINPVLHHTFAAIDVDGLSEGMGKENW